MWIRPYLRRASTTFLVLVCLTLTACATAPKSPENTKGLSYAPGDDTLSLGPGDEIEIRVYRHDDLNQRVTVPGSGVIYVPLAGEIDVRGMDASELRRTLVAKLDAYVVDPRVNVTVPVRRSQRLVVLGEVNQPGTLVMDGPTNMAEAIGLAGGFTLDADKQRVVLVRRDGEGKPVPYVLNIEQALRAARLENNPQIKPGDVVYVPPSQWAEADRIALHIARWMTPILSVEQAILLGYDLDSAFAGNRTGARDTNVIVAP